MAEDLEQAPLEERLRLDHHLVVGPSEQPVQPAWVAQPQEHLVAEASVAAWAAVQAAHSERWVEPPEHLVAPWVEALVVGHSAAEAQQPSARPPPLPAWAALGARWEAGEPSVPHQLPAQALALVRSARRQPLAQASAPPGRPGLAVWAAVAWAVEWVHSAVVSNSSKGALETHHSALTRLVDSKFVHYIWDVFC